jgi:hypothetical protein
MEKKIVLAAWSLILENGDNGLQDLKTKTKYESKTKVTEIYITISGFKIS